MERYFKKTLLLVLIAILFTIITACNNETDSSKSEAESTTNESTNSDQETKVLNNIELSKERAQIGDTVEFKADQLEPNTDYQLKWNEFDGHYILEGIYTFVGTEFTEEDVVILEGTSNEDGVWVGSFEVPEGFGGNHTVFVTQGDTKIGQTGIFVTPTFTMEPESGPVGTEITITAKGFGYIPYKQFWQVNYDNMHAGAMTAYTTNGKSVATFRASGEVGDHFISVRSGHLGSTYLNYQDSPYPDWPAPDFKFTVTDEEPIVKNYVEKAPEPADGGVEMPALENKDGVEVILEKQEGTVGEANSLTASGLPINQEMNIIWYTMVGSRVSGAGFEEVSSTLATVTTDADGNLTYDFDIPDDLGGVPHRLELAVGDEVYGQAYLRILPSIVSIEPQSGPAGTPFTITIKGGGWTEYDNAYYMTYDNSYMGYMCSFNSQGTLQFTMIATGKPGYHLIDLYPGIYKQQVINPNDLTLVPLLSYRTDHPGTGIPAIHFAFEITEE